MRWCVGDWLFEKKGQPAWAEDKEWRESLVMDGPGGIMSAIGDLWGFLKERKKWWLLPMVLVLLLFGVLIVLTSGSAVAPFVYTLF